MRRKDVKVTAATIFVELRNAGVDPIITRNEAAEILSRTYRRWDLAPAEWTGDHTNTIRLSNLALIISKETTR